MSLLEPQAQLGRIDALVRQFRVRIGRVQMIIASAEVQHPKAHVASLSRETPADKEIELQNPERRK